MGVMNEDEAESTQTSSLDSGVESGTFLERVLQRGLLRERLQTRQISDSHGLILGTYKTVTAYIRQSRPSSVRHDAGLGSENRIGV